ncbi:winged helix-turn-helix transcriptional regulator [Photobacterium leiognathi]
MQQTGKINQSEIARSLNLSRQRINVIIKTLHLNR